MAIRKMSAPGKPLALSFPLLVHGKDKKKNDILLGQVSENLKVANKIKRLAETLQKSVCDSNVKVSAIRVAKTKLRSRIGYVWLLVGGTSEKERIFHYVIAGFDSSSYHTEPIIVNGVDLRKIWINDFDARWERYSVSAGYISDYEKELIQEWMASYSEPAVASKQLDPGIEDIPDDETDVPVYSEPALPNPVSVGAAVNSPEPSAPRIAPIFNLPNSGAFWKQKIRPESHLLCNKAIQENTTFKANLLNAFKSTMKNDVICVSELMLENYGDSQLLIVRKNQMDKVTLSVIITLANTVAGEVTATIIRPQSKIYRELLEATDVLFVDTAEAAEERKVAEFTELYNLDDYRVFFIPAIERYLGDSHMVKFVTQSHATALKSEETNNESPEPETSLKIDPVAIIEQAPHAALEYGDNPVHVEPPARRPYVVGDRDFGQKLDVTKLTEKVKVEPKVELVEEPNQVPPAKVISSPVVQESKVIETTVAVMPATIDSIGYTVCENTSGTNVSQGQGIDLFVANPIEIPPFQSGMIFLGRDQANQVDYYLNYYSNRMLTGDLSIDLWCCVRARGFERLDMKRTTSKTLRDNFINTLHKLSAAECKAAYTEEQLNVILEWLHRNKTK